MKPIHSKRVIWKLEGLRTRKKRVTEATFSQEVIKYLFDNTQSGRKQVDFRLNCHMDLSKIM